MNIMATRLNERGKLSLIKIRSLIAPHLLIYREERLNFNPVWGHVQVTMYDKVRADQSSAASIQGPYIRQV